MRILLASIAVLSLPSLCLAADSRRPATGVPYEHPNGGCRFASDLIEKMAGPGLRWDSEGHPTIPKSQMISSKAEGNTQTLSVKGRGLTISSPGAGRRSQIQLRYDTAGKLQQLRIEEGSGSKLWAQTVRYEWNGDICSAGKVIEESPELGGRLGISFDVELCRMLDSKGLLESRKIADCAQLNDNISAVIETYAKKLPKSEMLALFTASPTGKVALKEWQRGADLAVSSALANDCNFYMLRGRSGAEGGEPARAPDSGKSIPAH